MKAFAVLVIMLGVSTFAEAKSPAKLKKSACGKNELNAYLGAIERFNAGELSVPEIESTRRTHLRSALQCKAIKQDRFCYEARQSATISLREVEEMARIGQADDSDIQNAQAEVDKVKQECQQN